MVSSTGIGSGLDIESLVTQLVAAERAPTENRLLQKEATLTSELSAFGTLQGALSGVQSSLDSLTTLSNYSQRTATSSNTSTVVATATTKASSGSYNLEVYQLASAQSLASGSFSDLSDTLGEGTLTIRFGSTDYTSADPGPESYDGFSENTERDSVSFTIDSSNNTLQGVRDAINAADAGVTAAIVKDGNEYRLLLSSDQAGENNSLEISVSDTGDGNDTDALGLSQLAFNGSANNLTQTVAAQDAEFEINGLILSSASNTLEGVIDGLNITLKDTTDGTPVTVSVAENSAAIGTAIQNFVAAYNNYVTTANSLTRYDAESGTAGALQGDFSARTVTNQMRSAITAPADGFNGAFSTLAEMGITTQADGTLFVDQPVLDTAIRDNLNSVQGVFAQTTKLIDSSMTLNSTGTNTAAGSYEVVVTQAATQGSYTGGAIAVLDPGGPQLTIDASNDNFGLTIDGVGATISLTHGTYDNNADLLADIQAQLDAAFTQDISAQVSFTASNELQITSSSFGSTSNVEIVSVDANTMADLGLSEGSGSAGNDIAGTIGGYSAIADGNTLRGATGSPVAGINVTIEDNTLGSKGTLDVSTGVAFQLDSLLDGLLGSGGLLDSRTESITGRVNDIADDREVLDRRIAALEARYRSEFNVLDGLLAQLSSTQSYVTEQLANIPLPGSSNN